MEDTIPNLSARFIFFASTSAAPAEPAAVRTPNLSFLFFSFSLSSIFCEMEETFTPNLSALFFSWSTFTGALLFATMPGEGLEALAGRPNLKTGKSQQQTAAYYAW